ncbi:MAG TPA: hypothetical protein VFW25_05780 [Silvibacterium sp.]|nr:hypothetical protein [Silvibacterium sp.]
MTSICRHIFPAGRRCTQPAVTTTLYCRHHQTVKLTLDKIKPTPAPYGLQQPLPFVFPEDRAALQINFMIVLSALNDKRITLQTANSFNRILRSCAMNLKQGPLTAPLVEKSTEKPARRNPNEAWLTDDDDSQQDLGGMVRRVILTPDGEEIAPICELPDEGEAESHGESCPCRRCAEEFRAAPPERHHAQCACELCGKSREDSRDSNTEQQPAIHAGECSIDLTSIKPESIDLEMVERAEQWVKERSAKSEFNSAATQKSGSNAPQQAPTTQASLTDRFHKAQFAAAAIAAGLGPESYEPWS